MKGARRPTPAEPGIEIVWEVVDDQLDELREALLEALPRLGRPPYWQEWRADDASLPARLGREGLGLYVDGRRVDGLRGARSRGQVAALVREAGEQRRPWPTSTRARRAAILVSRAAPAFLLAALPKCPMCLVVYASVLGIGADAAAERWLPWLGALLSFALVVGGMGIALTARATGTKTPLTLWLIGAACLAVARFVAWQPVAFIGGALVLAAAVAHAWLLDPGGRRALARLR